MTPSVINVDVDETIANWIGALFRLLDLDATTVLSEWDQLKPRSWDVTEVIKRIDPSLSANKIWRRIDDAGERFWADVNPFPWAHDLVAVCQVYAPVAVKTPEQSRRQSPMDRQALRS